jgi:hypothetical protein
MDMMIREHDISKMSQEEFIPYQRRFFPVLGVSLGNDFGSAWENHKALNPHHWENWTISPQTFPNEHACHCVCMLVDWMAMGLHFGDTAEEFYTKNAHKIKLPEWAIGFLQDMFAALRRQEIA